MKERLMRIFTARRSGKGEQGVTLIELLAVIVILAIIAAIAIPVILNSIKKARINATEQSETVIAEAFNRYAADNNGDFPTDSNDLVGNYLQSIPNDAWGEAFNITSTTTSFTIKTGANATNTITMTNGMSSPSVDNSSGS